MVLHPTPPGLIAGRLLEWKAQQISDPVARLRFLRRTTRLCKPVPFAGRTVVLSTAALVVAVLSVPLLNRIVGAWGPDSKPTVSMLVHAAVPVTPARLAEIWVVERKDDFEVYSNGLRIETRGAAKIDNRRYFALDRHKPESWIKLKAHEVKWRSSPAGIVFHTTESHLAPFESKQNHSLQRAANGVLAFVRENRAYHYVIDRFGRVHRTVKEESSANHAGWSVWADTDNAYVNLNNSFLGVSFEAQTRPQDGSETISPGQVRAGQMLTEMLRSKYKISAANCVTHGQVSVNPDAYLVGAHVDWAARFPFAAMGLPDNYSQPIPSITIFGFRYDNIYVSMSEASLWKGLLLADEELRQKATANATNLPVYRAILNRRFKDMVELSQRLRTEDGK